jgi:CrcB protein
MSYVWVALGGALGSVARYGCGGLIGRMTDGAFPFGTMVVNVTGAVLIGFLAALSLPEGRILLPPTVRLFTMTGICGGYTTFSTFSLETFNLLRDGEWIRAGANVLFSVTFCLLAVMIGYIAGIRATRGGA